MRRLQGIAWARPIVIIVKVNRFSLSGMLWLRAATNKTLKADKITRTMQHFVIVCKSIPFKVIKASRQLYGRVVIIIVFNVSENISTGWKRFFQIMSMISQLRIWDNYTKFIFYLGSFFDLAFHLLKHTTNREGEKHLWSTVTPAKKLDNRLVSSHGLAKNNAS